MGSRRFSLGIRSVLSLGLLCGGTQALLLLSYRAQTGNNEYLFFSTLLNHLWSQFRNADVRLLRNAFSNVAPSYRFIFPSFCAHNHSLCFCLWSTVNDDFFPLLLLLTLYRGILDEVKRDSNSSNKSIAFVSHRNVAYVKTESSL